MTRAKAKVTAKPRPSGAPQTITETEWYYEKPGSILVVHEVYVNGAHFRTDTFNIPWRKLMASAKRCGRKLP